MMDRVRHRNQDIDLEALRTLLGVSAVVPMSAREKWGISKLQAALADVQENTEAPSDLKLQIPRAINEQLQPVLDFFQSQLGYGKDIALGQSLRVITRKSAVNIYEYLGILTGENIAKLHQLRENAAAEIDKLGISHKILEATLRYDVIDRGLKDNNIITREEVESVSRSERADRVLTHPWFGLAIFITFLYVIFQSIFTFASVPMNFIDAGVGMLGDYIIKIMPQGMLRDLLVEGVISGVGAILIFLPQILILMFFLTLMEDSGYMARVAYMMDRIMNKIGLHGKSMLPLMSGYACAIPGIMASRTIDNWKERLVTIMVLPLMSCSARLPVYTLMISAFIPKQQVFGIFNLQGITMVFMYFLGTGTAMFIAAIISRFIKEKGSSSFIMELPPYRIPLAQSIFRQLYIRGKLFVINAGKIIMAISIVLWFLASFPKSGEDGKPATIHQSYAGRIGHAIEPVIEPLGFDWKIGVGLITSFAAREVVVSTLATLYNVEGGGDDVVGIAEALKNDINPATGLPRYTVLVALSIMVFYVYAAQCMATFAIVRNETNSWKWPMYMIIYMTALAYLGSLLVYQGGMLLGYS
jgi:ferrous iron transport protein B